MKYYSTVVDMLSFESLWRTLDCIFVTQPDFPLDNSKAHEIVYENKVIAIVTPIYYPTTIGTGIAYWKIIFNETTVPFMKFFTNNFAYTHQIEKCDTSCRYAINYGTRCRLDFITKYSKDPWNRYNWNKFDQRFCLLREINAQELKWAKNQIGKHNDVTYQDENIW
jgi:hypothetical protein